MTGDVVQFEGAVVDAAAFLDGTREFLIEAESLSDPQNPWRLTVSFRWPKEHDTPLDEGDSTVSAPDGGEVLAGLQSGTAVEDVDEDTGAESIRLDLQFVAASGEGSLAAVRTLTLRGVLTGDEVELSLTLHTATE